MTDNYAAFLRAVNVGGTGKLPMQELRDMCAELGFRNVRTYIASGNVVFSSTLAKAGATKRLEKRLAEYANKPVSVFVLSADEVRDLLRNNPFRDRDPKKTLVTLLQESLPETALSETGGRKNEDIHFGDRVIYVYYPDGMGRSKLKIPGAAAGTARNINTINKVAEMLA